MLEYLHILYHYQYFNRNPVQILTASPDGWERSWSLLFRLPELFGVSELSKSSSTIRKDKVQKSLKRSRQFTLNWKCKLQQFDWCQWLPMSEFPESPWHFIGCTSTGDRIICPTSCQHPSHRNSVGSRYEKTLFINSWSIHQENHPICLSTKPQIIEIAEFLDESSPKNPVGLRGGEPLHQGSCVRQLRSQGVQGQGAEVASDGNSFPFFSNSISIGLWRFQFKATNHIHQSL